MRNTKSLFKNTRVLITGGTGSWGQVLTTQLLLKNPKEIIIFSRGELGQVSMQRKFQNSKIRYIIGDIRDSDAINQACKNVDYVFHLAALKHVPVCEEQPQEAIKTNIQGTINLINASINNKVKKVIDVSTDKAVDPLNLYGMTKAVGEKLIIRANNLSDTRFVCIRGGNVMGSNGSVIPFFKDQIKSGSVKITDFQMTRYFLTLNEAIELLFKATEKSGGGETFVMNMPACYIKELAQVLIEDSDLKNIKISEIGMRPGEKLDELLISQHESPNTYIVDDAYYVIIPTLPIPSSKKVFEKIAKTCIKVSFKEFSSKTKIMNKNEIKTMLKNGGFIK